MTTISLLELPSDTVIESSRLLPWKRRPSAHSVGRRMTSLIGRQMCLSSERNSQLPDVSDDESQRTSKQKSRNRAAKPCLLYIRRWLQLRFDFDSTAIQSQFD